jgi:Spy/CpxP family protein refolding chaperone
MPREFAMRRLLCSILLTGCLLVVVPVMSAEPERPRPTVPDELTDAWERFQRALQDWGGRWAERFGRAGSREDRPVISQLLNNREALALSADQVRKLEQLRDGFQRQSIRNDADLRIVELDIAALLENEPVDLAKVEAKMREGEKLRTDLRIARVRAIEQARGLLNMEQKKKIQELTAQPFQPRTPRFGQNPSATERAQPSP